MILLFTLSGPQEAFVFLWLFFYCMVSHISRVMNNKILIITRCIFCMILAVAFINTGMTDTGVAMEKKTGKTETAKKGKALPAAQKAPLSQTAQAKSRMAKLKLAEVNFKETTITEAVKFMNDSAERLDPAEQEKKIRFVLRKKYPGHEGEWYPEISKIADLKIKNVSMLFLYQYVIKKSGAVPFVIDDTVYLLPPGSRVEMVSKTYKVSPVFYSSLLVSTSHEPFESVEDINKIKKEPVDVLLKKLGIKFPDGASVKYVPNKNQLIFRNLPSQIEMMDSFIGP